MSQDHLLLKAGDIVASYVTKNEMPADQVPTFLRQIVQEMLALADGQVRPTHTPAVPIEESYTDDYIICLEDGKKVTLLARYLKKHFDMTPEDYIEKWDLPEDYPMVTKVYSEKRSKIAKDQGLGKN